MANTTSRTALIAALHDPRCYPHAVENLHVAETHISWIVLTGPFAYKVKKPVDLGFLDFRTLEARRFYCEEELRLNRRLAPDLYLEVVAITGGTDRPCVGGTGTAIEYAVKMRQFREADLLDRVQARGELLPAHIDMLARTIATFHETCDRAPAGGPYGSPESVLEPARQNFVQMAQLPSEPADLERLGRLRSWSEAQGDALRGIFAARQRDGFVRECHGDLHLGNVFLENGVPRLFDCIEFNPNLRWIDVMNEVAFLVMDLHHRDHPDLARRFLNDYLEYTGDYSGLAALPYYLVYRAMVRAKVVLIRSAQPRVSAEERRLDLVEYRRFLRLADGFSAGRPLWVAIAHGLSGSGKSFFAQRLLEACDAIRVRSDVERKRLGGLAPGQASLSPLAAGLYTADATRRTYERLSALAAAVLDAGWPVIADATFLERPQRDLLRRVASDRGVPFRILDFQAPEALLRERVARRSRQGGDASEATLSVLERQLATAAPLGEDERADVVVIDARDLPPPARILRQLAPSIKGPPAGT